MKQMQRFLTLSICAVFIVSGLGSVTSLSGSVLAQTGDPVFVGAGDIANCNRTEDEVDRKTSRQHLRHCFHPGDNVYPDGTADPIQ